MVKALFLLIFLTDGDFDCMFLESCYCCLKGLILRFCFVV